MRVYVYFSLQCTKYSTYLESLLTHTFVSFSSGAPYFRPTFSGNTRPTPASSRRRLPPRGPHSCCGGRKPPKHDIVANKICSNRLRSHGLDGESFVLSRTDKYILQKISDKVTGHLILNIFWVKLETLRIKSKIFSVIGPVRSLTD